jgi:hypothetical protein
VKIYLLVYVAATFLGSAIRVKADEGNVSDFVCALLALAALIIAVHLLW